MRLIDADALKQGTQRVATRAWEMNIHARVEDVLNEFIDFIDGAPTVDTEPVRHGEWVKMRGMMPPEYMGLKECNKCGWHIDPLGRTAFDKRESEFRYCPRCGAKMNNQFAKGGKKVGDEDATD